MAKTSKNILDEARSTIKQIETRRSAHDDRASPAPCWSTCARATNGGRGISRRRSLFRAASSSLRIEEKVPDHKTPVILQCASGTRSLLAARTLRELGYENVYNLTGGFNAWKDRGLPWIADRAFTADELTRYSRHFVIPEVGEKGQAKLLDAKVLLLGTGALGSPSALYLAAAGVGTIGLVDFDVVDMSNLQRQIIHTTDRVGMLEDGVGAEGDQRAESRRQGDSSRRAAHLRECDGHHQGLRRGRELRRQFPDSISDQRRVRVLEEAAGRRRDFPLRRQHDGFLSRPKAGRVTDACILSRHRRTWRRRARRRECSARCRVSLDRSRRSRRSS